MILVCAALAADWVADVDRDLQAIDLDHLTGTAPINGTAITSRNLHHPDHALALQFLWARLNQIPKLVLRQEAFTAEAVPATNLIAVLPGRDPSLDPVVISAHYDSTAALGDNWDPATAPAPGADDDASGCAAVLEIARMLSAEPGFERNVEFILFDAEEQGLLGSVHHVAQRTRGVHAMISLDPVGVNTGGAGWLFASLGGGAPHMEAAFRAAADGLPLETVVRFDIVPADLIGEARSDHGPFLDAGFPAMHIGTFPPPPTYHTPDDTRELVDAGFLADATSIAAAAVAQLAQPRESQDASRTCSTTPESLLWGLYGLVFMRRLRESDPLRRGT